MNDAALFNPLTNVSFPPDATDNPVSGWLWTEGWSLPDMRSLAGGLGEAMVAAGIPVFRLRLTLRVEHPQLAGLSYTWWREGNRVEEFWPPLSILQQDAYLKSPYTLLYQGAGAIRRRLEVPGESLEFPVLLDLKEHGATDYVAMPLTFSDGRIHAATFASDRAGGFSTADLTTISEMLPMLARLMETHLLRITARTILDTYLGRLTGDRVLRGIIHRGDGDDIYAVIWLCDLRGSVALADRMSRPDYLELLNQYFDAMAGAVLDEGGEVLKFIGDALLAIFPATTPRDQALPDNPAELRLAKETPCAKAVRAARKAIRHMSTINAARLAGGEVELRYGIALHLGSVTFGNIGAPQRLDFTVIGPAVNETARLEHLCKALDVPVLISSSLARYVNEPLISLGFQALRGVGKPVEVFTLPADAADLAVEDAPDASDTASDARL